MHFMFLSLLSHNITTFSILTQALSRSQVYPTNSILKIHPPLLPAQAYAMSMRVDRGSIHPYS